MLDDNVVEQQEVVQEQTQEQPQQVQEITKEQNLRFMRERAEAAERRTAELEYQVRMNMSQGKHAQKMEIVDEDDDINVNDDDYIEGKHLKKYVKSLKQELKNTRKQFEEYNQKNSLTQAELQLKAQFNDFEAVVSKENLERLAAQKPALYRSIMANQDIYDRGYTAYELIKNSGIAVDYSKQDKRIEENKNKPRSSSNVSPQAGDTPLTRVGDYDRRKLTPEYKKQLEMQMNEAIKRR